MSKFLDSLKSLSFRTISTTELEELKQLDEELAEVTEEAIMFACAELRNNALLTNCRYAELRDAIKNHNVLVRYIAKMFLLETRDAILAYESQGFWDDAEVESAAPVLVEQTPEKLHQEKLRERRQTHHMKKRLEKMSGGGVSSGGKKAKANVEK